MPRDFGPQGKFADERLGHEAEKDIREAGKRDRERARLCEGRRRLAWIKGGELMERVELNKKKKEEESNRELQNAVEDPFMEKLTVQMKRTMEINKLVL